MFKRVDKFFVITVTNLQTLEAVSEWIYSKLKCTYLIQIEQFKDLTVFYIYINLRKDWDKKVEKQVTEYLKSKHLLTEKESD